MARRTQAAAAVLIVLSAGLAWATTQALAAKPTGSTPKATNSGTFTLSSAQTSTAKTLPLTGITITASCEPTPGTGDPLVAFLTFAAASGKTMDAFADGGIAGTLGGTSLKVYDGNGSAQQGQGKQVSTVIANSNGATATVTAAGTGDFGASTCTFFWQAVEAAN